MQHYPKQLEDLFVGGKDASEMFVRGTPEHRQLRKIAKALDVAPMQVFYHKYIGKLRGTCANCGQPTKFDRRNIGYLKSCSHTCDMLVRYSEMSQIERARLNSHISSGNAKAWSRDHDAILAKNIQTSLHNYGTCNPVQSRVVQKRMRQTCIERYGVSHHMHDPDYLANYLVKRYVRYPVEIGGKKYLLQGYEPRALYYLHDTHGAKIVEAGLHGNVPTFRYRWSGRMRHYTPDALVNICGNDWIIEVKSIFTLGLSGPSSVFERIRAKAQAVIDSGYRFSLMVVHKNRIVIHRGMPNRERLIHANLERRPLHRIRVR